MTTPDDWNTSAARILDAVRLMLASRHRNPHEETIYRQVVECLAAGLVLGIRALSGERA